MSLPENVEPRSREEWEAVVNNPDAAKRRLVSRVLRDLGEEPTTYMTWTNDQKIDRIMQAQGEGGEEEEEQPKKKKGAAKKTKGSSKSKSSGKAPAGGSSADVAQLEKKLEKMEMQVEDLQDTQAQQMEYIKDMHFLVRVMVQSDEKLKYNSEDLDLQEVLYGETVVDLGNDD
jgi:hypothetical protein